MAEPEQAPEQPKTVNQKQVIASKVTGTVKWFNVKSGYGFINRNDTKEDVFVHQSAIIKNNPKKVVRSVGDGEIVEFSVVVGEKGHEAANVTGPNGEPVKGSPYAADRRRNYRQWYPRGGRGGPRGGPRRPPRDSSQGGEGKLDGVDGQGEGGGPPQRRFRPRRGRGGYGYYNRGPYRGGPIQDDQGGDGGEGGPRGPGGRGPPRRFYRRNFRGGRGGGGGGPGGNRRALSQDSQGQGGAASGGEEGGQQHPRGQRPRYRKRGPVRARSTSGGVSGGGNDNGGPQQVKQQQQSEPAEDNIAKAEEPVEKIKLEESQPVQNTTTESTA